MGAFVDAMLRGEREHLAAFVSFVRSSVSLRKALIDKDWARFAGIYNGPEYWKNQYDARMAAAYKALTPKGAKR